MKVFTKRILGLTLVFTMLFSSVVFADTENGVEFIETREELNLSASDISGESAGDLSEDYTEDEEDSSVYPDENDSSDDLIYSDGDSSKTYALTYKKESAISYTITGYTGTASGTLEIPAMIDGVNVTKIGEKAFYNCSGFTGDLVIPEYVREIGESAFEGCKGFNGTLKLPQLNRIQNNAFSSCGFTGSLSLPDSLTYVGDSAFLQCKGFTGNLTIPTKMKSIRYGVFQDCSGFTGDLVIPDNVTEIGGSVFSGCHGFTSVTIPSNVTRIDFGAFWCTGLNTVNNASNQSIELPWVDGKIWKDKDTGEIITSIANGTAIQQDDMIGDFSYSFGNFSEATTRDFCYYMYGENELAENLYMSGKGAGGNCFGMATTAGMFFFPQNGVDVDDFYPGHNKIKELREADANPNWTIKKLEKASAMSVKDFIQVMFLAQYSPSLPNVEKKVNNPLELYQVVENEVKKGKPVEIGIYGEDNGKASGHSLLAYGIKDVSDDQRRIQVYDCNNPLSAFNRTININNVNGEWKWSYRFEDGTYWGSGKLHSDLDYITYDGYYQLWNNRGNLADSNINSFFTNADDLNIYSNNTCLATLTNGHLETANNNIWVAGLKNHLPGDASSNSTLQVNLPVGNYTIERTDPSDTSEWIISYNNVELGGKIKSKANKVSITADDKKGITQVQFDEGTKDDFEIELRSSKKNESDVTIKGTSAEAGGIVKMENGQCQTEGVKTNDIVTDQISIDKASITSSTYNGTEQIPTVTYNGKTLAVNTDYTWEKTDKSKEYKNAGTYEVILTGKGNYTGTSRKSFTITPKAIKPTVTLAKKEYTYNGKAKKPAVTVKDGNSKLASSDYSVSYASGRKNVGAYKVTVNLKGNYSGKKTATFKILPKGTSLNKPKAEKKAIKVNWKKQTAKMSKSRIAGYQIQVATDKKFTKNKKTVTAKGYKTTSKKITKLKGGKKYFIRIRTYMTVGGKKYYSPWSKASSIKTKK